MFFFNIPTNERPCQSVAEDAWIQSLTSVWVEDVLSVAEIPDILENKEVGAIIFIIPLIVTHKCVWDRQIFSVDIRVWRQELPESKRFAICLVITERENYVDFLRVSVQLYIPKSQSRNGEVYFGLMAVIQI